MKRSQKKPQTLITVWPPGVWDAASYMITICSLSSVWAAYHPDPKWQAYQFFSICQCFIAIYTSKISGIMPQLAKKWQNLARILFNVFSISCFIRSVRAGCQFRHSPATSWRGEHGGPHGFFSSGKVVHLVPYSTSASQVFFYNPYPCNKSYNP